MKDVERREVLGGLIVGLNCGQFLSQLLATVELPDFRKVNFSKPRDSVSDVVENEAQSTSCFGCRKANAAYRLDLPAKRVSLRHSSDVVLVGRNRGCRMGRFGIRRCGLFVVVVLAFLR